MIRIGHNSGLSFELSFESQEPSDRGDEATFGRMAVWLGEDLVWGRLGPAGQTIGIEWYWIELLEHLASNWDYFEYEQGYPFGVKPVRPSGMMAELAMRWRLGGSAIDSEAEESTARAFESSHNLALALSGCLVPDLWIVHEGRQSLIEAKGKVFRADRRQIMEAMTELGECIADRIDTKNDRRSELVIQGWRTRGQRPIERIAEIITRVNREALSDLAGSNSFDAFFKDARAESLEDNVILDLVYRCKGAISDVPLRRLIEKARSSVARNSPYLDKLSNQCRAIVDDPQTRGKAPYLQGRRLGLALRDDPALFADRAGRADPEAILQVLAVPLERWSFDSDLLDAVAVWGHGLNPWIVVNHHEKHVANRGAERATIAHEICHLLVDRFAVLPHSAIVGGAMDREAEQRANSFAAELLCPRFALNRYFDETLSAKKTVENATRIYGVSKELAALQLANSQCELSETDRQEIQSLVSPHAWLPWSL